VHCAAPLEVLSCLVHLEHLVLADWAEPPSAAGEHQSSWAPTTITVRTTSVMQQHRVECTGGILRGSGQTVGCTGAATCAASVALLVGMAALQQLPRLTSFDISRCLAQQQQGEQHGASVPSQQPVSLLTLLTGATKQQQQWQLRSGTSCSSAVAPAGLAATAAAVQSSASAPSTFFSSLKCLKCTAVDLVFEPAVWGALSHLSHLNVTGCDKFKGEGLSQLTALQELVARGECAGSLRLPCSC
jgi:hypothetical protein